MKNMQCLVIIYGRIMNKVIKGIYKDFMHRIDKLRIVKFFHSNFKIYIKFADGDTIPLLDSVSFKKIDEIYEKYAIIS